MMDKFCRETKAGEWGSDLTWEGLKKKKKSFTSEMLQQVPEQSEGGKSRDSLREGYPCQKEEQQKLS